LREAAELMVTRKLKRLPVVDAEGRLVGIIGRLDVLKLVANTIPTFVKQEQSSGLMGSSQRIYRVARDVMVTDVATVHPEMPVAELLERLVGSHLRRLIVVDEERKILGIVTDADLVARVSVQSKAGVLAILALSLGFRRGGTAPQLDLGWRSSAKTAEELMTREVITIGPEEPLENVIKLMVEQQVKFLPVQTKEGQLLGVVLRTDILRAITESMNP
jgi:CBS domain-containing protein